MQETRLAESLLNAWWLFPVLWATLAVVTSAALRSLRSHELPVEGEPELPTVDPIRPRSFDLPDSVSEVIGWYEGAPIYRSVRFGEYEYEFDRIRLAHATECTAEERIVAPGIVYSRREAPRSATAG